MTTYDDLQRWYLQQCDGSWEHYYGVTIQSLDNPGWMLTVDLVDTPLAEKPFDDYSESTDNSQTWLECTRKGHKFVGACGPLQLTQLISKFLAWTRETTGDC